MRILIFDNDIHVLKFIEKCIWKYYEKTGLYCECISISDCAVLSLQDLSSIQVAFVGVDGKDGMETAISLHERQPLMLEVLISETTCKAPEGYYIDAFRYLLKSQIDQGIPSCLESIRKKISLDLGVVQLKVKDGFKTIKLGEVLYIEGSANRKVYFHMDNADIIEGYGKMAELEKELCSNGFLRIQRGFLVNMDHIMEIKNYFAVVSNGEILKTRTKNYKEICGVFRTWKLTG